MIYGSWDIECDVQNFLSFWNIFCPFTPPNNSKNQNFEKMKITPGDIIILHMCTINDNHMMFGSLYLDVRDGQKFLSFWTIFCPFTPVKTWKIKIFEKWKNRLEISSFYTNVTKMIIICYIVPKIRCKMGCKVILIFHFGLFYGLLPALMTQKIKILQKWKTQLQISSFYTCFSTTYKYEGCNYRVNYSKWNLKAEVHTS